MNAEIISIGDELLIGQVVNTNASWIAEQLSFSGIEILRITAIADQKEEIISALREAEARAEIILLTGGLGPTRDDITKNTLCEYFGSKLVFHQPAFDNVTRLFGDRGLPIGIENRRQAEIPDNCTPIMNAHGTAPGMWWEKDGRVYVSMPGVPFEMKAMILDHVLPKLRKRLNGRHLKYRIVQTQGMGESMLAEKIQDWETSLPSHIKLAYLPQPGIVRLRLSGVAKDPAILDKELDDQLARLRKIIPDLIFAEGETTLEKVVGELLHSKGASLSTAESCTGGYIAHLITSISGSSRYFKGSVVAYANEIKTDVLGVKKDTLLRHGAVSGQTVKEMAEGIRKKYISDYSISVSGIAGPDGGSDEKPVGTTWIAVAGPDKTLVKKFVFGKNRERNIRLAAVTALNMCRKLIAGI